MKVYLFSNSAGVNKLRAGANDTADLSCLLKVTDGTASKTGVDLHAIRDDGSCDEFVGGNILQHLIVGLLVINDSLFGVFLHLGLGPLLLETNKQKGPRKNEKKKKKPSSWPFHLQLQLLRQLAPCWQLVLPYPFRLEASRPYPK